MIGSLLFFALYPLSRYLRALRPGVSKKDLPPAVVNGRAEWDGGAVTTRSFIQSQTTPLDQWLSPSSEAEGETKKRMREPSPEKEVDARMNTDKEQQVSVLCDEETDTETLKMSEMQHDEVEVPKPEDVSTEQQREQHTEAVSPEEALGEQFKCLQTDDGILSAQKEMTPAEESTQDTTCSAEKEVQIQSSGADLVTQAEDGTQETTCSADVQIQSLEESVSPAENNTQESTCSADVHIQSLEESVRPAENNIQESTCSADVRIQSLEESVSPAENSTQESTCCLQREIQIPSVEESVSPAENSMQESTCSADVRIQSLEESVSPAENSTQESTCSADVRIQSLEESVSPAENNTQESTCCLQREIQIPSVEETVTPSRSVDTVNECWDEYLAPSADEGHGGENSSELIFISLLSNTQSQLQSTEQQTSWHFPAGPGLAEEVQCPLLQFPTVSYYPPPEPMVPFEVMWRVWEEADDAAEPTLIPFPFTKMDFTVMSYNILAQDLLEANQDLYVHCPLEVLDWSYRCNLLLEEILKWAPDILCLQEVQENHYHEQLYPVLTQMGYTCVYKRRTGDKTDGCATCYRNSCFSEVSVTPLEYFRPETELLDRHNVGLVLLLRPVATQGSTVTVKGPLLCVANTHLLFNPRRGDVKLAQLAIMLAEIDSTVKSCTAKGEHCNVVLCGDFNSVPGNSLYQLITTGELYYHGLPAWMISGQEDLSYKTHCYKLFAPLWPSCLAITDNCQYTTVNNVLDSRKSGKCQYNHDFMLQLRYSPAACVRPVGLAVIPDVTDITPDASRPNQPHEKRFRNTISHRLDLESVYKHILPGSGSPEVTTLHSEVGATVDYIFYSPKRTLTHDQKDDSDFLRAGLKLTGSLSLLSEDVLWSMNGLPSHMFPSDHLSLLAKFQMNLNVA